MITETDRAEAERLTTLDGWADRVTVLAVNPGAATPGDVANLADDLMAARRLLCVWLAQEKR